MSALTRTEAHDLVDAAAQLGALALLAAAWDVPGHWDEHADWDAAMLHEFVDEQPLDDATRSRDPRDDDDTGLPDCELL